MQVRVGEDTTANQLYGDNFIMVPERSINLKKLAEEVGRDWDLPVDREPMAEPSYYDVAETVIDRQWES